MDMRKLVAEIIVIYFIMLVANGAFAQTERSFTIEDGLASNNVTSLIEDRNGDLWIGTSNGISQFDGSFTTHLEGNYISECDSKL